MTKTVIFAQTPTGLPSNRPADILLMKPRKGFAHASRELLDAWISSDEDTSPDQIYSPALKLFTASMVLLVQGHETVRIVRGYEVQAGRNAIADEVASKWVAFRYHEAQRQARPISARELIKSVDVQVAFEALLLPQKSGRWVMAAIDIQLLLSTPESSVNTDDIDQAILHQLYQGFSAKEIGQQLRLSHRTVEHRVERLKQGFGARTMSQLVALSIAARIEGRLVMLEGF
ncbi:LuxR C-terminal-related transcriptional regulator [Rhizobium sp. N122]|uniref:helix-turn-helix transcriptional regulator n=1 Tax=Rhizobium sp. N122 TaxID=1764272 RepID=UPI001AEC7DD4|nr:LuxR C-terminal-related transcriptional regulator [Rhizobium sp. N122]